MKRWLRVRQPAGGFEVNGSEAGYTITEVMIVLAVTSAMFVAVVLAFSGRQARVEFNQGVRNYEASLQTVMNEVATGNYQSNFACTANATGPPTININTPVQTGTNKDCIFIGKVVIPGINPNNSSVTETIVGRRLLGGQDVKNLTEANPIAVSTAKNSFSHSFGLKIRQIQNPENYARLYGVGFFGAFSQGASLSESSESDVPGGGEGLIRLYGLTQQTLAPANGVINPDHLKPLPKGAVICVEGQNGQYAEITIGGANSQSTITSVLNTKKEGESCSGL